MNAKEQLMQMTRKTHQHEYVCRGLFERRGALSYIGHLDLKAVFERALRRAQLPILYSQGFNPRPMLVFALPLGVGINTEGDWLDVSMEVPVDADEYVRRLNAELPDGLKMIKAVSIDEPKNSIMSVVTCAEYRIEAPGITQAMLDLFARDSIITTKKSKGRQIEVDIRPLLIKPLTSSAPDAAEYMCFAGSQKNLRPDVFINAMCETAGLPEQVASEAIVTRTSLYGGEYPSLCGIEGLT